MRRRANSPDPHDGADPTGYAGSKASPWLARTVVVSRSQESSSRTGAGAGSILLDRRATGSPPVRDISATGLYVVTEERWYPGTLVLMTLQNTAFGEEVAERTICVHSRAVRWGKDGVGLQFVLTKDSDDPSMAAADRKALDRFLQRLRKSRN